MITSTTPQVADNVMASVIQEADDLISGFKEDIHDKSSMEILEKNRHLILNEIQSVLCKQYFNECSEERQNEIMAEILSLEIRHIENILAQPCTDKGDMPKISLVKPKSLMSPNTKVANCVFNSTNIEAFLNPQDIEISGRKAKKHRYVRDVSCFQMISEMKLPANINLYDKHVFSAICTLYEELDRLGKETVMTSKMIYQTFTGTDPTTEAQVQEVTDSVHRMMCTILEFDWREHAIMNKLISSKDYQSESCLNDYIIKRQNMIYAKEIVARIRGHEVQAFFIMELPPLFNYSKKVNQVTATKIENKNITSLKSTRKRVLLKEYLINRIDLLKNAKNNVSNKLIRFDTMFSECGLSDMNKTEKMRMRNYIFDLLNELIKKKEILSYEVETLGREKIGIIIKLN